MGSNLWRLTPEEFRFINQTREVVELTWGEAEWNRMWHDEGSPPAPKVTGKSAVRAWSARTPEPQHGDLFGDLKLSCSEGSVTLHLTYIVSLLKRFSVENSWVENYILRNGCSNIVGITLADVKKAHFKALASIMYAGEAVIDDADVDEVKSLMSTLELSMLWDHLVKTTVDQVVIPELEAEQAISEVEAEQVTLKVEVERPIPEVEAEQAIPEVKVEQAIPEVVAEHVTLKVEVEQAIPEVEAEQVILKAEVEQAIPEVKVEQAIAEVEAEQAIPGVVVAPEQLDNLIPMEGNQMIQGGNDVQQPRRARASIARVQPEELPIVPLEKSSREE